MAKTPKLLSNTNKLLKTVLCFFLTILPSLVFSSENLYIRGDILHFLQDPSISPSSYEYIKDGLLITHNGKVKSMGLWESLKKSIPQDAKITHYKDGLIMPGFIDTHIHYPQLDMIAANSGGDLLQWLNTYTFPFEKKFQNKAYATDVANYFLDELLRNGTTTAMIFSTIYPDAIDALFEAAQQRNMRIITGEVLGDRNLPAHLIQNNESAIKESQQLINKWHHKPNTRLLYAIEFRFAPTSSDALLKSISVLKRHNPDVYVHTHISENKEETAWSKQLFQSKDYLSIYDKYDLLGERTILAHGVHLTANEEQRIHDTQSSVSFCPTSNLFLGSGLFNIDMAEKHKMKYGLGTDIGAGTSFSLLQVLNEAYKVAQLQNQSFSALKGFYLATLGGAKALHLESMLGNFTPGKEADFIVLNMEGGTPLLKRRLTYAKTLEDKLFVLMTFGDDRSILATYINGGLASPNN